MKKNSLGKGLDALLAIYDKGSQEKKSIEDIIQENDIQNKSKNSVVEISLSMIDPDKNQPRKIFNEDSLKELADSIKIHGVIQPIVVIKKGERYQIIAGERRWRASKLAEVKTIPAIIKEYTPQQIREISIVENLQREDLNPIESARAIKELMDEFNWTHDEIAERLGKSRPSITNSVRLLNLQPEVIELVEQGKISTGHARTLITIENRDIQLKLAKQCVEKQLTVRDIEKASKLEKKNVEKPIIKSQSLELRDFARVLTRTFGTKVSIVGDDNRGKIVIDYFDKNDLERIYDIINAIIDEN